MKLGFRHFGKIGFILIFTGFLMPILNNQNGFQIANFLFQNNRILDGVLLCLFFIYAVIGIVFGILLEFSFTNFNKDANSLFDWLAILFCLGSGLIIYFRLFNNNSGLQNGIFLIIGGWILTLIFQIISKIRKEQ